MSRPIEQRVKFPVPPEELFRTFLDSVAHSRVTGAPARLSRKVGAPFTAFGGMLLGRNIAIVPNRMIVQTWRSSEWKKSEHDSVLVLTFHKVSGGGEIHLVHVGVPQHDHAGVSKGWPSYYWKPWKALLTGKQKAKKK
jgi:activator of HSP90 ATPase